MSDKISFELITPEGLVMQEQIYEVLLPTPQGQIGVLPEHKPLISIISPGILTIKKHKDESPEQTEYLATSGGFVEITGNRVRLLADAAERAADIDELKAKEALEKAKEMKSSAKDQVSLADATSLIDQNMARLKVAELRRRHHPTESRIGKTLGE